MNKYPRPNMVGFRNNNPFACRTLGEEETFTATWIWNGGLWSAPVKFKGKGKDKVLWIYHARSDDWLQFDSSGYGHLNITWLRQKV